MPHILLCFEHEKPGWDTADWTPDVQWDHQQGNGLVASATINGVVELLRCGVCRWAPDGPTNIDPTKQDVALGTVGDPTLHDKDRDIIRKSVDSAQVQEYATSTATKRAKKGRVIMSKPAKAETPKKRERRGHPITTRKFGNIEVAIYLRGGSTEDVLKLTKEQRDEFFAFLTGIKDGPTSSAVIQKGNETSS